VFVVTGLCTASTVIALASSVTPQQLAERPSVLALYTAVRLFDTLVAGPMRVIGVPALTLIIVTPLLQILWQRAQLTAAPIQDHARYAASVYGQAAVVYGASAAYTALLGLLASALGSAVAAGMSRATHNAQLAQSCGVLCSTPLWLAALVHGPCVADRAQLELARGGKLGRLLVAYALRSVDLRVCLVRAGFSVAMLGCAAFALLPRVWLGVPAATAWSAWASWLLWAAALLMALARTGVRAAWLAWLTERALAGVVPPRH
jgi:hypothetical protein